MSVKDTVEQDDETTKREQYPQKVAEAKAARQEEEAMQDKRGAFIGNLTKIKQSLDKEGYTAILKREIEKKVGAVKRITIAREKGTGLIEFEGTQERAEKKAMTVTGEAVEIYDSDGRKARFDVIRPKNTGKGKAIKEER